MHNESYPLRNNANSGSVDFEEFEEYDDNDSTDEKGVIVIATVY